jgi:NAD(P)-dependent dehydrogenase (short-subunit alcohol dehydrogenase family)
VKTVVVTGVSGTLGGALAEVFAERGWSVLGVSRRDDAKHDACERIVANPQRDLGDARALLAGDPELVILCAGQIEREVGPRGLPLPQETLDIYTANAVFPSLVALAAAEPPRARPVEVVAIGSIADGMPSSFGPVYHASKIALHYFYTAVAPIAAPHARLRLYRPGVIRGPLAWAPLPRLNERGRRLRAKRCENAPDARVVAQHAADWIERGGVIGGFDEPLSFRALRLLFALSPRLYARVQRAGWRAGSRFA